MKTVRKPVKRINALIAIVRDIEKTQTLPTNAMLLSLFGENIKRKKPKLVEKKVEKENKEEMISKYWYTRLKEKHKEDKEKVMELLSKVEYVKPRFGNPYWKIDTNATELAIVKNKMQRD